MSYPIILLMSVVHLNLVLYTLLKYFLDNNGTFPAMSYAEYHFLPGVYPIMSTNDEIFENLNNFTIVGA